MVSSLPGQQAWRCQVPHRCCRHSQAAPVRVRGGRTRGPVAAAAAAQPGALLIEVDGALCDLHMDGHRVAFNRWVQG
jgi:hypothetical protein